MTVSFSWFELLLVQWYLQAQIKIWTLFIYFKLLTLLWISNTLFTLCQECLDAYASVHSPLKRHRLWRSLWHSAWTRLGSPPSVLSQPEESSSSPGWCRICQCLVSSLGAWLFYKWRVLFFPLTFSFLLQVLLITYFLPTNSLLIINFLTFSLSSSKCSPSSSTENDEINQVECTDHQFSHFFSELSWIKSFTFILIK